MPAPRPVRRRPGRGRLLTFIHLFILPHTVIGIGALAWALYGVVLLLGPTVSAQVTQKAITRTSKGGVIHTVYYSFPLGAQREQGQDTVSAETYSQLERRDRVPVRVPIIGPPLDHFVMEGDWSAVGEVSQRWFFTLIWDGVMAAFWWLLLIRPLINRNLVATGRPATATVTQREMQRGKTTNYYLRYEFTTHCGEPIRSRMSVDRDGYFRAREGEAATVLYSETRPRFNVLYPYGEYEVVE